MNIKLLHDCNANIITMHPETIKHWCREDEGANLEYSIDQTVLFRIVLSATDAYRLVKTLRCILEVIRHYPIPSDTLTIIDLRPTLPVVLKLSTDPRYVIEVNGLSHNLTDDAFRTICRWLKDITVTFRACKYHKHRLL